MRKKTAVLICLIITSTSIQWSEQLEDGINNINDVISNAKLTKIIISSMMPKTPNLNSTDNETINAMEKVGPIPLKVLKCTKSLKYMSKNIMSVWALQMLDSFGKPPGGILVGNFYWPGSFDECLRVKAPKSKEFPAGLEGRYCKLWTNKIIHTGFKIGICVPNPCGAEELKHSYTRKTIKELISGKGILKNKIPFATLISMLPFLALNNILPASSHEDNILNMFDIDCTPVEDSLNIWTFIFVLFILFLIAVIIVATFLDFKLSQPRRLELKTLPYTSTPYHVTSGSSKLQGHSLREQSAIRQFSENISLKDVVECFSVIKNTKFIFDTSNKAGDLSCMHGIRTITMAWIIYCHTVTFSLGSMNNVLDIFIESLKLKFCLIINGTLSVDTFFLMSGFLFTYLFLKDQTFEVSKGNICKLYILRYIRLTPAYMTVLVCIIAVPPLLGTTTNWDLLDHQKEICYDNWWKNVLYISNLNPIEEQCVGWGWYLSCDTQFFIIASMFLIYLKSSKTYERQFGLYIALTILFASWFNTAFLTWSHGLPPAAMINNGRNFTELATNFSENLMKAYYYLAHVYIKPQHRIPTYIMGCLLGYVLFLKQSRASLSRMQVWTGWVFSCFAMLLSLIGIYFVDQGPIINTLHVTFARSVWAAGVSWVIFACLTNNGGPVNAFLSLKVWIPLSRMTYCTYLTHPAILMFCEFDTYEPHHFSYGTVFRECIGYFVISYAVSFCLTLLLESPIIRMTKLYKTRETTKKIRN